MLLIKGNMCTPPIGCSAKGKVLGLMPAPLSRAFPWHEFLYIYLYLYLYETMPSSYSQRTGPFITLPWVRGRWTFFGSLFACLLPPNHQGRRTPAADDSSVMFRKMRPGLRGKRIDRTHTHTQTSRCTDMCVGRDIVNPMLGDFAIFRSGTLLASP